MLISDASRAVSGMATLSSVLQHMLGFMLHCWVLQNFEQFSVFVVEIIISSFKLFKWTICAAAVETLADSWGWIRIFDLFLFLSNQVEAISVSPSKNDSRLQNIISGQCYNFVCLNVSSEDACFFTPKLTSTGKS